MYSDYATTFTTTATDHGDMIAQMLLALFPIGLLLLISAIVFGTLTRKLARHKGYTGYFWTGFFLTMIGLIYVVGLPDRSQATPRTPLNDNSSTL